MTTKAVCMATFNGERFIREQIESVLTQLGSSDILVICDDGSNDKTVDIIKAFRDPRIRFFANATRLGYAGNFQKAIFNAHADHYFFCDQDDLWPSGRLAKLSEALGRSGKNIAFGAFAIIDSQNTNPVFMDPPRVPTTCGVYNVAAIFLGIPWFPYYGCTAAITHQAKSYIFPLPRNVGHDIWTAIMGNFKNDIVCITDVVTYRRIHERNVTNARRGVCEKVSTRLSWLRALISRAKEMLFS